jgi:hypothetical protein
MYREPSGDSLVGVVTVVVAPFTVMVAELCPGV